jgi:hypothetical protein
MKAFRIIRMHPSLDLVKYIGGRVRLTVEKCQHLLAFSSIMEEVASTVVNVNQRTVKLQQTLHSQYV